VSGTPRTNRKRPRSVTPSDAGAATNGSNGGTDEEYLRSPLAKRKKLAAERTGYSKLKEGITAEELKVTSPAQVPTPPAYEKAETASNGSASEGSAQPSPKVPEQGMDQDDDTDDDDSTEESDEDEVEEDDFLARALEEEWG